MQVKAHTQSAINQARKIAVLGAMSLILASCGSSTPKVAMVKKDRPKEYFSESLVGVKASPRVVNVAQAGSGSGKYKRLPRGGGREMVGKPYKVRGKWYHPKEVADYSAEGTASWYGDAFHGRLTANGEIYDMNHLSAAHTTMPLPSYARVTNLKNGKSVIVRINDRGPYAHNRMIDLSKKAAQLLDYTQSGTAQVRMDYIGRAPVHGKDDEYLLASYQDGSGSNENVMVAMNNQPSPPATAAFAPTEQAAPALVNQGLVANTENSDGLLLGEGEIRGTLPQSAPVLVDRPSACVSLEPCDEPSANAFINGYAKIDTNQSEAFSAFELGDEGSRTWKSPANNERVLVGVFSAKKAAKLKGKLKKFGLISTVSTGDNFVELYAKPIEGQSMDQLVRKLWADGFTEAFVVR